MNDPNISYFPITISEAIVTESNNLICKRDLENIESTSCDFDNNGEVSIEHDDALSEMEFEDLIRDIDEGDSNSEQSNTNLEINNDFNKIDVNLKSPLNMFYDNESNLISKVTTCGTVPSDIITDFNPKENQTKSPSMVETEASSLTTNIVDNNPVTNDQLDKRLLKNDWTSVVKMCFKAVNPTRKNPNNYLRGCLWSPDGTCLLTNSNDNIMRIYELPRDGYDADLYNKDFCPREIMPVLNIGELEPIYDYCWYPFMNSSQPETCLFASTSRKGSVRLWDAYHGTERAYVQPYDHLVEPVSAHSIAFSRDGTKMYCGFNKCIRVFDIGRLSSTPERRPRIGTKSELRGIISCIATSAANIGMYGCGSFSKDAAIYHEQTGERILEFLRTDERLGGITHIEFSPVDMNTVATGGRIDSAIHVWDLRCMGSPLYSTAMRDVHTNQRIYFQFDSSGQYIVSGNHNGHVSVYDLCGPVSAADGYLLPKVAEWSAHNDVCNGVSLHPSLPLLATTSGQRRVTPPWQRSGMMSSINGIDEQSESDWSSDDECKLGAEPVQENELRLWSLNMVEAVAVN